MNWNKNFKYIRIYIILMVLLFELNGLELYTSHLSILLLLTFFLFRENVTNSKNLISVHHHSPFPSFILSRRPVHNDRSLNLHSAASHHWQKRRVRPQLHPGVDLFRPHTLPHHHLHRPEEEEWVNRRMGSVLLCPFSHFKTCQLHPQLGICWNANEPILLFWF